MALGPRLIRRIAASGPLTLAEYMVEALLHPEHGYYMTSDPLGRDFTTAPEISQMFGELVGLCLAQAWMDQGAPSRFVLAELGPGRGTLMADLWRATAGVPGFHEAADLWLVEVSPVLRAMQAERVPARHADTLADLPEGPIFLIANEFFDALPVRQAVREGDGWREKVVVERDGQLGFGLTPAAPLAGLAGRLADVAEGDVVEWHPALPALAQEIGRRVAQGGAALIVDYGCDDGVGDSFQAVAQGAKVDPLAAPGRADLTAHVNFAELARASDVQASATTDQGEWLRRLGLDARATALAARDPAVMQAHHRLSDPSEMGSLFKALALVAPGAPLPPGFDPRG